MEALNRKLSWEPFPAHLGYSSFKGFMCSALWRGSDKFNGSWDTRFARKHNLSAAELKKANEKMIDKLYRYVQKKARNTTYPFLTDSKSEASVLWSASAASSEMFGTEGFRKRFQKEEATSDLEYEIDAITNRKVYKNSTTKEMPRNATEVPTETFRGYRSQFHKFIRKFHLAFFCVASREPRALDHTFAVVAELRPSTAPWLNLLISSQDVSECELLTEITAPGPEPESEPDPEQKFSRDITEKSNVAVEPPCPVQEGLKEYDSKVDYKQGHIYDVSSCGINYEDIVQKGLKDYDEKAARNAQRFAIVSQKTEGIKKPVFQHEDQLQRTLEHYKATVERPKALVRAIQAYEKSRRRESRERREQEAEIHPLVQAIQEFELSRSQAASVAAADPLLKAFQEYETRLSAEKMTLDERGQYRSKDVGAVLDSIAEYKASLFQAGASSAPPSSVEAGLKDYDSKVDYSRGRRDKILQRLDANTTEDIDLLRASDIRAAAGISKQPVKESEGEKLAKREELEHAFNLSAASEEEASARENVRKLRQPSEPETCRIENSELQNLVAHARGRVDAKIAEIEAENSSVPASKKLTGNFVRDFPEQFESSWQKHESGSLVPKSRSAQEIESNAQRNKVATITQDSENLVMGRIVPALDRASPNDTRSTASKDQGQTSPMAQGEGDLSASVTTFSNAKDKNACARQSEREGHRDLVRSIRSIYEENYGTIDSKHRQVPSAMESTKAIPSVSTKSEISVSQQPEPTVYKVLAYDPTMQSISIAETSSIVPDTATALTPAEVLLRLSNPTKFFPHFQELQAAGYEIVSGSADILVFRKVHAGAPKKQEQGTSNFRC